MLASFVGFQRGPTEILLVCSRDILAPTLKRLSMFVLRAKAKLQRRHGRLRAVRPGRRRRVQALHGPREPWTKRATSARPRWCALYPADGQRARPVDRARGRSPRRRAPTSRRTLWQWGEVRSGIATITAPIVEAFVPQMLNYESVGGVNFKKGCYPGQEVVARSQFRGTLKRRGLPGARRRRHCRPARRCSTSPTPSSPAACVAAGRAGAGGRLGRHRVDADGRRRRRPPHGRAAPTARPWTLQPLPYLLLADV